MEQKLNKQIDFESESTEIATKAIELVQQPLIKHRLQELGSSVTARIAALNIENQVATEDTVTTLKSLRAELNKEAKEFESQRKMLKDAIMNPYNEFEDIYKSEIIEKYKVADGLLKNKINNFEMKIKVEKQQALINYFNEIIEHEGIQWLTFERLNIEVGLSVSLKKYKEQILEKISKIIEDLDLIKTETFAAEILVDYKKTLNASQSITSVRRRKEQERLEQQRIIDHRTDVRLTMLHTISFVKSDIAKAYYFVHNNEVSIPIHDIETLENEEWTTRYVELESMVKEQLKKDEPTTASPLKSPTVEAPETAKDTKQEVYQAKFVVTGTIKKLTALKEFLISNNYQYQNL